MERAPFLFIPNPRTEFQCIGWPIGRLFLQEVRPRSGRLLLAALLGMGSERGMMGIPVDAGNSILRNHSAKYHVNTLQTSTDRRRIAAERLPMEGWN